MSMPVGSSLRARAATFAAEALQVSVREVLYVIFWHKWKVLALFFCVFIPVTVYTFTAPNVYEAKASLLMRIGRENIAVDPAQGATMGIQQNDESKINSELSIITSRHLAEKVVDTVGESSFLRKDEVPSFKDKVNGYIKKAMNLPMVALAAISPTEPLPPRERAIVEVGNNLTVAVERKTSVINLSYDSKSPELARDTLDTLIKLYLDRHIEVHSSQASPTFFQEQASQLETSLTDLEKKRDDLRAKYEISNIDSQKEALLQQINETEIAGNTATADARAAEASVAALESALKNRPKEQITSETSGLANTTAEKLKTDLANMQLQETDLAARYPATYRPLIELREQIKQIRTMLAEEKETLTTVTKGVDPTYQQLLLDLESAKKELTAHEARSEDLAGSVEQLKRRLADLTSREAEMARMDRDISIAESEYRNYREGLQRAKISAAMDIDKISNVSVVQSATVSPIPVKPKKLRNLALAIFAVVFGGVFLAFGLEYLNSSVRTPEDIETRLRIPVLAVIGEEEFNVHLLGHENRRTNSA